MKSRYIALIATLFVASCESSYDDAGLQSVVQGVEQNQTYLTQDVENLKKSIAALEERMTANDAISNIAEMKDADGEVVGYTLTFASGESLEVKFGENGADGDKGATGDNGADGDNAVDGDKGATGDKGDAGADGTDHNIAYTYVDGARYVTITLADPTDATTKEFKFLLSANASAGATEVGDIALSLDGAAVGAEKIDITNLSKPMTIKLPADITSDQFSKIKVTIYGEDGTKGVGILPNGGSAIVAGDWNMTFTDAVFSDTGITQPTLMVSPKAMGAVNAFMDVTLIATSGSEANANVAFNYDIFKVSADALVGLTVVPDNLVGVTDWIIKDCTTIDLLKNVNIVLGKATWDVNLTVEGLEVIDVPNMLSNAKFLKSLDMPNLKEITVGNTFGGCVNLETLRLPELTVMNSSMCVSATSLKTVYLPKVITMGQNNFKNAEAITSFTLATDPSVETFTLAGNSMTAYFGVENATLYVGKKAVEATNPIIVDQATGQVTFYNTAGKPIVQKNAFKSIEIVDNTK